MAPHVQRVFGASPGAVGKLLFSAPSVSLAPARSWSLRSAVPRGALLPRSLLLLLGPGILARSAPSRAADFFPLAFYFLTPPPSFKFTPYPRAIY